MFSVALLIPDWPALLGVGAAIAIRQTDVSLAFLSSLRLPSTALDAPSALCTASDASRLFLFRRDGLTDRMAASIWRLA